MKNKIVFFFLCSLLVGLCFAAPSTRHGQSLFGNQKFKRTDNVQKNDSKFQKKSGTSKGSLKKDISEVNQGHNDTPNASLIRQSNQSLYIENRFQRMLDYFENETYLNKLNNFEKILNRKKNEYIKVATKIYNQLFLGQEDTVRYLALTKRYGWYYGIGSEITKEEAGKVPCYFRLTEKDNSGHFTKIEAVNGYGRYTNKHGLTTYLSGSSDIDLDSVDSNLDSRDVVQWRLYPDADMQRCSMESGYDADGNLIYTYISTQFNDTTSVGHYVDSFGEPISLLNGDYVAKYVQIDFDSLGYERRIRYIDENANFRRSPDGVFMVRKSYDSAGNTVMSINCAINGIPLNARSISYNDRGQILEETYLDDNLKPVKTALIVNKIHIMSRRYNYDINHRLTLETALYDRGSRVKEREYDERGNIQKETKKDSIDWGWKNQIENIIICNTYTPDGELISKSYRNKDNLLENDSEGICLYVGKNTYRTTDGRDTIPVYTETIEGTCVTTTDYKNNLVHIYKTDKKGQEIESAYFDLDKNPVENDGYFLRTTSYKRKGNQDIQESETYSFADTIRTVTITDRKEHTRIQQTFHKDMLLSSYGQTLSDDLETVTGQYGFDALGNIARSHLEEALYYKVKSGTTYRGATSYMSGKNEYDEPSYVAHSENKASRIYCTMLLDKYDNSIYLDENNKEIENLAAFRDSLNKVYCIEAVSQKAIDLGLKSGDIIVRYAGFYYPEPINENWIPRDQLQTEIFLSRKSEKELLVLRYFPEEKKHKIVSLTLPQGTSEDFGFIIQTVYYTQAECNRYRSIVNEFLAANNIDKNDFTTNNGHYGTQLICQLRPFKISTGTMTSWREGLRQDVIVLGVQNKMFDGSRTYVGISEGYNKLWDQFVSKCDSTTIFYTVDGNGYKSITLPFENSAISRSYYYIPQEEYDNLIELSESIELDKSTETKTDSMDADSSDLGTDYTPEQAYDYITKNAKSISSYRLAKGDSAFEEFLKGQDEINPYLDVSGAKDISLLDLSDSVNRHDKKLATKAINGIDWSGFKKIHADDIIMFIKYSPENETNFTQFVMYYPENFFMIMTGLFKLKQSEQ